MTAALVFAAAVFVVATLGSSLMGSTSFYGGGLLVNQKPWAAEGFQPVEVTNNFVGDTVDFFIPGRSQIVDRVYAGDLPGWDDRQGAGSALGSVPTYGLLAPTAAAWWLLPHDLAPAWEKLTILVVAAAGTALFLRRLGIGGHGAWLAGLVYATSGFMIAWTNWPQAGVAAMLPWLFWSVERALQLRTWRSCVPMSVTVGFLLLGGFPAVVGLGLYVAGGYAVLRLVTASDRTWRRSAASIGRLTVALVVGVALAGVQLVAFAYSYAALDTTYRADAFTSIQPLRMALTSVFPNAWGTLSGGPFDLNPIESNAYLGAAAAVLAVLALVAHLRPETPRGVRTYFAVVLVVGGLLIYVQGPALSWVGSLPVFSGNAIGRLVSVLLLAAAVLAGLGLDAGLRGGLRRSGPHLLRWWPVSIAFVAAVYGLGIWILGETQDRLDAGGQNRLVLIAVGCALATAIAVAVAVGRPSRRSRALAIIPVLVSAQALTAAAPMWAQVDRGDFYPSTSAHEFLAGVQGSDRTATTGATMVNGSTAFYGLRSATGHVFTTPRFADLQRATCSECQLSATYWVLPGPTDLRLWQSPGLDRMGVRYLTSDPESQIPGTLEVLDTGGRTPEPVPGQASGPLVIDLPGGPMRGLVLDFADGPADSPPGTMLVTVRDDTGDVVLTGSRFIQFPRAAVPLYVPLAGESLVDGAPLQVELSWAGPSPAPRLFGTGQGVVNVTVVRPSNDGLRLVHADSITVWERLTALPRIRWAASATTVESDNARIVAVARRGSPADTVVLDEPGEASDGLPASTTVLADSGDEVVVRVEAEGAGYLVLADSVQSDWTATVDGQTTAIVAADHAFGAVHLERGTHEVVFSYTPAGTRIGVAASAAGIAALLLMSMPPAWSRRRER